METFAKARSSQFSYFKPASFDAKLFFQALHDDDAVSDALELKIVSLRRAIVQEHHGAIAAGEVALQA